MLSRAALMLALTGLLTAGHAAAGAAQCSWDRPGHDPFMGDVVAAVDRYRDIKPATRAKLKARMAAHQFDEIVTIRADRIEGAAIYAPEIRDMHFGQGRLCGSVTRAGWTPQMTERGLVYCEDGECILVPTVCRNVSRIRRLAPAAGPSPAPAGPGGGSGGEPSAGPMLGLAGSDQPGPITTAGGGLRTPDERSRPGLRLITWPDPAAPEPVLIGDSPMQRVDTPLIGDDGGPGDDAAQAWGPITMPEPPRLWPPGPWAVVTLPAPVPAVPEAPTWALMAGGLAALLAAAHRRRRAAGTSAASTPMHPTRSDA